MNPLDTSLRKKFDRLDSVTQSKRLTEQIDAIEAKAIQLREKSEVVSQHLTTLINDGLCDGVQWALSPKLLELNKLLDKTIERLRVTPEKVKDDQLWAKCERLAHDATRELNSILKSQWRAFINNGTQNRVEVFSAFRGLAQCRDAIEALERNERQARARLDQLPEKPEDITFIVEIDESMTDLIDGIGIKDEPEEMINFLKRCASGSGVPLSELTDERLAWLRSNEFGESLKIRG
jgi:hypothetical protein